MQKQEKRTWCKYGNCSLEKLEFEIVVLNKLWTNLEKSWVKLKDIENVYRIYPLLDTTAAIARKMMTLPDGKKNNKYKVETVMPSNEKAVDTSEYLFSDEYKFFNGKKKEELLGNIISIFLHGSEYVYMDTRKLNNDDDFKIYVFVKTDKFCQSCAEANLASPKNNKNNFRNTSQLIRYDDCICGQYINIRSYINSILKLISDQISKSETKKQN